MVDTESRERPVSFGVYRGTLDEISDKIRGDPDINYLDTAFGIAETDDFEIKEKLYQAFKERIVEELRDFIEGEGSFSKTAFHKLKKRRPPRLLLGKYREIFHKTAYLAIAGRYDDSLDEGAREVLEKVYGLLEERIGDFIDTLIEKDELRWAKSQLDTLTTYSKISGHELSDRFEKYRDILGD